MSEPEEFMPESAPSPANLQEHMLDRERRMIRKNLLLILPALPGILLDLVFVSLIVWLLGPFQDGVPWRRVFYWCIPVTILLFWWDDTQSSDSWTADNARWGTGDPTAPGGPSLDGRGVPRGDGGYRGEVCTQLLSSLLLFGPSLLRRSAAMLWTIWKFRDANRQRAEQLLRQMATVDYGVAARDLLRPREPLAELLPTLAYLRFYGWIDTSQDLERIWFPADVRTLMQELEAPSPTGAAAGEEGKSE